MVSGPATTFYELRLGAEGVLAGLRLRPGAAAAVIGQPLSEFRDHLVPIDSVIGVAGHGLTDKLLCTTASRQRVALLEGVLAGFFADAEPVVDQPVAKAVEMLRSRPQWPVSGLALAVGLSERQLRRRFDAAVGYGPKRLGRIFRFQRLLDLIHAGDDQASVGRTGDRGRLRRPVPHDQRMSVPGGGVSHRTSRRCRGIAG